MLLLYLFAVQARVLCTSSSTTDHHGGPQDRCPTLVDDLNMESRAYKRLQVPSAEHPSADHSGPHHMILRL
jgi:hypothetical protein